MTRNTPSLFLVGAAVSLGWVLAGCRHTAVSEPAGEAQSSFRLIVPPAPPPAGAAKGTVRAGPLRQIFTDARPILPLANPVFPAEARAAKVGVVTVAVHLTIDVAGRVTEVAPSLAGFSIPNRFSTEFRRAVEEAVAQWRFTPAEVQHLEEAPGEGGSTYLRVARREKIEAACDVQFTFTATGAVLSGVPVAR